MSTRLVLGLGNPGAQYAGTRHNVGFLVIDAVATEERVVLDRTGFQACFGQLTVGEDRVYLAKPQTFMNLSGRTVRAISKYHRIAVHDIVVVYDDMDLPTGHVRLRARGSSGGHRGMQSVIEELGSSDFPRIRVGIGRPPAGWEGVDWVLSPFGPQEKLEMAAAVSRAAQAVGVAMREGFSVAMNLFNSRHSMVDESHNDPDGPFTK